MWRTCAVRLPEQDARAVKVARGPVQKQFAEMREMRERIAVLVGREDSAADIRRRVAIGLAAATAFAALTALGARVQFFLPFTPVPVTGQVFCVLLAGCVLGPRLGFLSQVEYLAAGAAGLPIFAFGGGPGALLGWTGGYIVGFSFGALVVGALWSRWEERGAGARFVACLSGVAVIYLFGAAWFAVWSAATGAAAGLAGVLVQATVPFIAVDVPKAALAAALAPGLRARLSLR
jgi:biotin transport system substrate-specific component